MIQCKQPKKVKGTRKKVRKELTERLMLKFPTWFEGKTDKEIRNLITAFKSSKKDDDQFPAFCIGYEAWIEKLSKFDTAICNSIKDDYIKSLKREGYTNG